MIKLTGLWKETDKLGRAYYSGMLGRVKVLIYKNQFKEKDTDPEYHLYFAEPIKRPEESSTEDSGDLL